jgi:hypothetical protein
MADPRPPQTPRTVAVVDDVAEEPAAPAPPPPEASGGDRSLADLLSELTSESATLIKQEVRLAKAEARQEIREAGAAAGRAVAGGAVAYVGLIALVIGLGWGLGRLLDDDLIWLGITIAGLVVALVGALLLKKALDAVRALTPPLDTTAQTLHEDKQWLTQQTP